MDKLSYVHVQSHRQFATAELIKCIPHATKL